MRPESVAICGGGIAGLTAAVALQRQGIEAHVYEAAPSLKPVGAGLLVGANAIKALGAIGLADEVKKRGKVLVNAVIRDASGRILRRRSARHGDVFDLSNFAVHRADLHDVLSRSLAPGSLHLDKKVVGVTLRGAQVAVRFADGQEHVTGALIGADGIHSAVRGALLPEVRPRYGGYACWRGLVDEPAAFDRDLFSETWGAKGRFGIVPLPGNRVYYFACVNAAAADESLARLAPKDVARLFASFHAPIPDLLRRTDPSSLLFNDIADLPGLATYAFGKVALIGDAAHATTPNLGQGACQAIEDAVVLAHEVKAAATFEEAARRFSTRRWRRTQKVIAMSWSLGKVAQIDRPWLCRVRNAAFRLVPTALETRSMRFLFDVDFTNGNPR